LRGAVEYRHRRRCRNRRPRLTEHDTVHGTHPATAKAAKTIIAAVESDEPPAFLRLCKDALRTHRRLAAARLDTIQTTWENLTTTTDIDI
jgi:hypothetical protein